MSENLVLKSVSDLQANYKKLAENHLLQRFSDNPEFQRNFLKTFSDLVFSQNDEMQEMLLKMKQNSLLNAVYKATEAGASFAKKEVSLIPFEIFKKESKNNVERKIATGEFDAVIIFDINFQKQQILKMPNCKKFFTAEVKQGVKVIEDLSTGNCVFEGVNDATKPTIGYYAVFITTEGIKYDKFMSNSEIIERAKFNRNFDKTKYTTTENNIHYEKIVVRNLIKEIPQVSDELKSIISSDEIPFSDYTEIKEPKINQLEKAKKELAPKKAEKELPKTDKTKSDKSKVGKKEPAEIDANKEFENEQEFF